MKLRQVLLAASLGGVATTSSQPGLAEPLVLIHAGPSQVPDKPPRA